MTTRAHSSTVVSPIPLTPSVIIAAVVDVRGAVSASSPWPVWAVASLLAGTGH